MTLFMEIPRDLQNIWSHRNVKIIIKNHKNFFYNLLWCRVNADILFATEISLKSFQVLMSLFEIFKCCFKNFQFLLLFFLQKKLFNGIHGDKKLIILFTHHRWSFKLTDYYFIKTTITALFRLDSQHYFNNFVMEYYSWLKLAEGRVFPSFWQDVWGF